ncbi:tyrosine-protein phosphatase [Glutamicibacter ectropisis]|uniref:Tyrosine-protein phosphatase n=1 Tax=Glutamicibacter ectropisis TaxID=3046593 RepID=A0AAU6WDU9_9MICC
MHNPTTLSLDGLVNFRDLGGITTAHGTIRPGVLFRSESVSDLSATGRQDLASGSIRTVIDLRSEAEVQRAPGLATDSLTPRLVALPLLDGAMPTSVTQLPTLETIYQQLVTESGAAFARAAGTVADAEGGVLIHCTAGKDRTGLAVALTLLAVGADLDQVRADYIVSSQHLAGAWAERMLAGARAHGVEIPDTEAARELIFGTSQNAFDAAMDRVYEGFGSAQGYLLRHGLLDDQLERLAVRLVES